MKCIDDEIPFEIPEGWEWARGRHIFLPMQSTKPEGEYFTYIDIDAVNNKANIVDKPKRLPCSRAPSRAIRKLEQNCILFSMVRPYLKNIALIGYEHKDAIASTGFYVIRPCSVLYPQYIFKLLLSAYVVDGLNQYMKGDNSPSINNEHIESYLYPIPPYCEQSRIVEKLDGVLPIVAKYDWSQSELDKLNEQLYERLKKSILQEAIQGKLVPQDPNDESASVLLERIRVEKQRLLKEGKLKKKDITDSIIFKGEDNKYYEKVGKATIDIGDEIHYDIPNSWAWARLQSICKITNGFTPLRSEERFWKGGSINWFTVDDIHEQGEYITETKQRITQEATSEERIVRAGSVLLCCTASIGQCAITRIATTTNQQFNALTIKDEYRDILDDEYLFLFAKTLKDELNRLAGTTTFAFVSVKKVGNILIPIPPIIEQKRIVDIVKKSISSIMSR